MKEQSRILTLTLLFILQLSSTMGVMAGQTPSPKIDSVNIDRANIELGEWVTVTIKATNYGFRADEMYISASMPENPPTENIEIIESDLQETYILGPGDQVWGDYGQTYPITLQYPLIEGYTYGWENQQTKTLKFKFKPHKIGTFHVYIKTTAQTGGEWRYDPSTGAKDQQNEYVYVYEVYVFPSKTIFQKFLNIYDSFYNCIFNSTWWWERGDKKAQGVANLFSDALKSPAEELYKTLLPEIMQNFLESLNMIYNTYKIVCGIFDLYGAITCHQISYFLARGNNYPTIHSQLKQLRDNTEQLIQKINGKDISSIYSLLTSRKQKIENLYESLKKYDDELYDQFTSSMFTVRGLHRTIYLTIRGQVSSLRAQLKVDYEYSTYLIDGTPKKLARQVDASLPERNLLMFGYKIAEVCTFEDLGESKYYEIKVTEEDIKEEKWLGIIPMKKELDVRIFYTKEIPFQIYLAYEYKPTSTTYDAKGEKLGESGMRITIEPKVGTYYVLVTCPSGYGDYEILARIVSVFSLKILCFSPVSILITDPMGFRIGYDPILNRTFNEIAEATYSGPESHPQIITIEKPLCGNYTIFVYGIDDGQFKLNIESIVNESVIVQSTNYCGQISKGEEKFSEIEVGTKSEIIQGNQTLCEMPRHIFSAGIYDSKSYYITMNSNSTIFDFKFSKTTKSIMFEVEGPQSTTGLCNITIPCELLGGPYTIILDNTTMMENYDAPTNGTYAFIYISYTHSRHTIKIIGTTAIPEFSLSAALLGFLLLSTLPTVFRQKGKLQNHFCLKNVKDRLRFLWNAH